MKRILFGVLAAAVCASAAHARPSERMVEIRESKAITLAPTKAYLLFHLVSPGMSPVFLRIPSAAEKARYDTAKRTAFQTAEPALIKARQDALAKQASGKAVHVPPPPSLDTFDFVYKDIRNAQTVKLSQALEKAGDDRTMFVEAPPGDYVLYGIGLGQSFMTCLCLGSVSFHAAPGQITDLGTILIAPTAKPSREPELASETGFGPSMNGHWVAFSAAIRPSQARTATVASLAGKPVVAAPYRATGKFVAGFALSISRLAPIPGVLGYDRGNVLDLVAHRTADNHY